MDEGLRFFPKGRGVGAPLPCTMYSREKPLDRGFAFYHMGPLPPSSEAYIIAQNTLRLSLRPA